MSVNLSLLGGAGWQFFTDNGTPLAGGLLYTYLAGTSTAATTYTTSAGNVPNSNPIVLNSAGRVQTEIWLTQGVSYKFVLKTSAFITIGTYDNIDGAADPADIYAALAASSGSSLVGFIQSGSGAVATTVQTKLRESVSVMDFIPLGTSTSIVNCTPYFESAKTAALAQGKALFIPAGTYLTSITIASGESNLQIVGENRETTILEAIDSSTATISIHWAAFRVQIESLKIQNTIGTNNGTHYGIWGRGSGSNNGASGLKIKDCIVKDYNVNIRLDEFNDMYVENCVLSNAVAGAGVAPIGANFYAGSPTYACVGLNVTNVYCIAGKYGMYLENTEGIKMSFLDCVLSTAQGLIHQRTTGNTVGMIISDSYFDSTTLDAFYLEGIDYGMFTNIWTSASTVAGTGNGLQLVNCSNNMFTNLTAYGCKASGLLLLQDCTLNTFNGCTFNSNASYGVNIPNSNNSFNVFNGCFTSNNTTGALNFLDTTVAAPNYWLNSIASGTVTVQTKDIKQGGNASGGVTFGLTYQEQNLPDGVGAVSLEFTTGQTVFVAPRSGSLISISVALNDTRTAGTLYARPTINGTADDDLRVQIDGTSTQYTYGNVGVGIVPVAAGDLIGVYYDSTASWDTTGGAGTVDITATLVFIST